MMFSYFGTREHPRIPRTGSVKSDIRGCGRLIAVYSVALATKTQKNIVAITGKGYEETFKKCGWIDATTSFPERMAESHEDKKLWLYPKL